MKDPLTATVDLVNLLDSSLERVNELSEKIYSTNIITHLDALTLAETLTIAASAARGLEQRIMHEEPLKL